MAKAASTAPSFRASTSQQELESWYEQEVSFFHDQPFYPVYRDVLKAGATIADLQYIDFLRRALAAWDSISKSVLDELMDLTRRQLKLDLSTLPPSPPGFIVSVAIQVLNAVADEQQKNPTLSNISNNEWYEKFIRKPWEAMVNRQRTTRLWGAEVLPSRIEKEMDNRFPLYKCFVEAVNRLNRRVRTKNGRVGRKSDPGGSIFLLAVQERLAKINCGSSHRLAGRLLRTLRSGNDPKKITRYVMRQRRELKQ